MRKQRQYYYLTQDKDIASCSIHFTVIYFVSFCFFAYFIYFLGLNLLSLPDSDASHVNRKSQEKRQNFASYYGYQQSKSRLPSSFSRQYYYPDPRYLYNSRFASQIGAGQTNWPMTRQQTALGNFVHSQPQPRRQFNSNYYPQRKHYRDWSQKVLATSTYERQLENEMAKQHRLPSQEGKTNHGAGEIQVFVAGVNANGKLQGEWVNEKKFENDLRNQRLIKNKPSAQNVAPAITNTQLSAPPNFIQQGVSAFSVTNSNSGLLKNQPTFSKLAGTQTKTNPLSYKEYVTNRHDPKTNSGLPTAEFKYQNLERGPQTNNKVSAEKPRLYGTILSDNLGGAVLGPNAHSLLQSESLQQNPTSGSLGNLSGGVSSPIQPNRNSPPKSNMLPKDGHAAPGQNSNANVHGQNKNANTQHGNVNSPANLHGNLLDSLPQKNVASHSPNINSSPATFGPISMQDQVTNGGPRKGLALESAHIDKTTAQNLSAIITGSQEQSKGNTKQSSNTAPINKNSSSKASAPENSNPNHGRLDTELALKKFLSSPNEVVRPLSGLSPNLVGNGLSSQQAMPSFPAFRYEANHPDTRQGVFKGYRRNNIPHPPFSVNEKKVEVPHRGPLPYKGSFPLMLHKISPYLKMKRNLKLTSSNGKGKERRRFLELQSKLCNIIINNYRRWG